MSSYFLLHGQRFSLSAFAAPTGIVQPAHAANETRLVYLHKGLLVVEDERGFWSASFGQVAWFPPHFHYSVQEFGQSSGIVASLAQALCAGLPEVPCVLNFTELVPVILERAVTWQEGGIDGVFQPLAARQERLLLVLLDELHAASQQKGRLVLPKSKPLNEMAREILASPVRRKSIEEWAQRMNISSRSISRHFSRETGMSFAQWRQCASLMAARQWLAQGESVRHVARRVGYENVSAFIASFRKLYGPTPSHFRQQFL